MKKHATVSIIIILLLLAVSILFYNKGSLSAIAEIGSTENSQISQPQAKLDDAKWYKMAYENADKDLQDLLQKNPLNIPAEANEKEALKNIYKKAIEKQQYWVAGFANEKIADIDKSDSAFINAGTLFMETSTTIQDNDEQKTFLIAKAKQLFQKAVKINPENISANNSLAISIIQLGQDPPMMGIGYLKKSLQIDSNDINTNYLYAQLLILSEQKEKAIEVYNKLVNLQPQNAEHYFQLSKLYAETKNVKLAKEYLDKAKSLTKK